MAGGGSPPTPTVDEGTPLERQTGALLASLAAGPRGAGTPGETRARALCADRLRALGFTPSEQEFGYSALPGRWGTPLAGAASAFTVASVAHLGRWGTPGLGLLLAVAAACGLALSGSWAARRGVLRLPWMRRNGVNLLGRHGDSEPELWLVAHLDSKSQPVPIGLRVAGVIGSGVSWLFVAALSAGAIAGMTVTPTLWVAAALLGVVCALPLMVCTVGNESVGALDNASGVATILAAAALLPDHHARRVGVAITSAEELGLAGARSWATRSAPSVAINCDSIDGRGTVTVTYSGTPPTAILDALRANADVTEHPRVRRQIPGILTDHMALTDAGWQAVTVSRGDLRTLGRIHSRRDDLRSLGADAILPVARLIAGAAGQLLSSPDRLSAV